MKKIAKGPDAGRKAGGELPYSSQEKVLGGPNDGELKPGLGADKEVKGRKSVA